MSNIRHSVNNWTTFCSHCNLAVMCRTEPKRWSFLFFQDELIKDTAAGLLPQISEILNKVPRQMLLIFKTNDLIRGIETSLKTRADTSSFITMSKCCIRALFQYKRKHCDNLWCKVRTTFSENYCLLKIIMYQWYLWISGNTVTSSLLATFKYARQLHRLGLWWVY